MLKTKSNAFTCQHIEIKVFVSPKKENVNSSFDLVEEHKTGVMSLGETSTLL